MGPSNYHLTFATLIDLAEGRIVADESVRTHLTACTDCSATLAWLTRVIGLMQSPSEEPPAHVVQSVKQMFRQRYPNRRRASGRLLFDSARMAPSFVVRAGAAYERQILFSIDEYDLDLRVVPHGSQWVLSGQILGSSKAVDEADSVELSGEGTTVRAQLNHLSEFVLPPVPTGLYSLLLMIGELVFDIQDLEVGL